jgi:hypothetical protein
MVSKHPQQRWFECISAYHKYWPGSGSFVQGQVEIIQNAAASNQEAIHIQGLTMYSMISPLMHHLIAEKCFDFITELHMFLDLRSC